jgi:hypothetical protein
VNRHTSSFSLYCFSVGGMAMAIISVVQWGIFNSHPGKTLCVAVILAVIALVQWLKS